MSKKAIFRLSLIRPNRFLKPVRSMNQEWGWEWERREFAYPQKKIRQWPLTGFSKGLKPWLLWFYFESRPEGRSNLQKTTIAGTMQQHRWQGFKIVMWFSKKFHGKAWYFFQIIFRASTAVRVDFCISRIIILPKKHFQNKILYFCNKRNHKNRAFAFTYCFFQHSLPAKLRGHYWCFL